MGKIGGERELRHAFARWLRPAASKRFNVLVTPPFVNTHISVVMSFPPQEATLSPMAPPNAASIARGNVPYSLNQPSGITP
jgi:hypothetical protein